MAEKTIQENPTITDTIVFEILTPDADGCFLADPYKVEKVSIYYVERTFFSNNFAQYTKETIDDSLQAELEEAKATACIAPTAENLAEVNRILNEIEKSKITETLNYNNAVAVAVYGSETLPAWLSTDTDNALITHVTEDEDGNTLYGNFSLSWEPLGQKEGDYIINWLWKPYPGSDYLYESKLFTIYGNTQITTSIPTHFTQEDKYETLLERYLPEMFKVYLNQIDLTPEVLQEFNGAIAKGFTFLENQANQIVDLIDANATHESLLPYLSNLFNLKLRTTDPTLWRRQIKQAVPLFKKKGTYAGLVAALDQASITLNSFTKLWQVQSEYTYQEAFLVTDRAEFELSRTMILPLDEDNFELYHRAADSDEWVELNSDYVDFSESDGIVTMIWIGDELSVDPITLGEDDEIRVIYEIVDVPSPSEQDIEDYIRTLDLMDQRDWRDQDYPYKNWNIRLIEEDDTLFDTIIPTKHPFQDAVTFGKVRTEFPYSENIYNMEEYNGSLRDSIDPCDIDKNFIETCKACQSSKYNVDLEIENLSDGRITEAISILEEFTPFHAVLHSTSISGGINEFVPSPIETIESLITIRFEQLVVSGNAQNIFNRTMEEGLTNKQITRNMLAESELVVSDTATIYSENIIIYSPDVLLGTLSLDVDNLLQILAPHVKAGNYSVTDATTSYATAVGIVEPVSPGSSFSFNLSNIIYSGTSATFSQNDLFYFDSDSTDLAELGVKSDWDVENDDDYTGAAWEILLPLYSGTPYTINNILPNGRIILNDPLMTLPTSNQTGLSFTLYDDDSNIVATGSDGNLYVDRRGEVDLSIDAAGDNVDDFRNFVNVGYYLSKGTSQYKISGFVKDEPYKLYISDYTGGAAAGQTFQIFKRLVTEELGYLDYKGLYLITSTDYEATLPIVNGVNPPSDVLEENNFKENYLIKIGTYFYQISEIDGTTIWLSGPNFDVATLAGGGAPVDFDIYHFTKTEVTIEPRVNHPTPGHTFSFVDRRGNEIITSDTEEATPFMFRRLINTLNGDKGETEELTMQSAINDNIEINNTILNLSNSSQMSDSISHNESISFKIEWDNGFAYKGEL